MTASIAPVPPAPRVENFRLQAALRYAALGWCVFPLHHPRIGASGPPTCSCTHADCGSIGKHPMTVNGLKDATRDAEVIRAWWGRWPAANIGVATGVESGFVVLDVDEDKGGRDSLFCRIEEHGELPATVESETGGGGMHLLFAHPGVRVPNGTNKLGKGLDVRGDGGYIVAPPSLHASGRRYAWAAGADPAERQSAALPAWLRDALVERTPSSPAPRPAATHKPDGRHDSGTYWLGKALAKASYGNRNETGAWLAQQLRDAGMAEREAEWWMRDYAERCPRGESPYTDREALATLRSIYSRPARNPAQNPAARAARPAPVAAPAVKPLVLPDDHAGAAGELERFVDGVLAGTIRAEPWPWPILDRYTQSLVPGALTMFCGDPGSGKTYVILQAARFWQEHAIQWAAFFLEKDRLMYSHRLLAQLEGSSDFVDLRWMRENAQRVREGLARHRDLIEAMGQNITSATESRVTLGDLQMWVRAQAERGTRVAVIDPVTMASAGKERWIEDEDFVVGLLRILGESGMSLILVTHPKGNAWSTRESNAHQMAGGTAYPRFVDTVVNLRKPRKPKTVEIRYWTPVAGTQTRHVDGKVFFELHKTRFGKGQGAAIACEWDRSFALCELGTVVREIRDNHE